MALLVLDKSAVVAVTKGFLRDQREHHGFLLTNTLLYEIASEKLDERERMAVEQRKKLDARIAATLAKAREAGDEWTERNSALTWEIVEGTPARNAPKLVMRDEFTASTMLECTYSVQQECLAQDRQMGKLASFVHEPEDEEIFKELRSKDEVSLFHWVETYVSGDELHHTLALETRAGFSQVGQADGLEVSASFLPGRDWLSYGVTLASRAYLPWKFWRVGDSVADTKKPANPFFDNLYIAFMAIADGVLSADKNLLKLAWACWPEKRENMFEYDMSEKQVRLFKPRWAK